jgi:hypothetical protein
MPHPDSSATASPIVQPVDLHTNTFLLPAQLPLAAATTPPLRITSFITLPLRATQQGVASKSDRALTHAPAYKANPRKVCGSRLTWATTLAL